MDHFSANLLLKTLENGCSIEDVAKIYKSIGLDKGGPTLEQVSWFNTNKGKQVRINGTPYTGIVSMLNTASSGFYEGIRYPVYIKIDDYDYCNQAKGMTFEYGIEQLEVIN